MLLKTFFIILAAFLVYYFGFYTDRKEIIERTQKSTLESEKNKFSNITRRYLQYLLANAAEVLNKNITRRNQYFKSKCC